MNIVLFDETEIASPLPLSDPRARHIIGVLGKRAGDAFEAGVVNGMAGTGRITRIEAAETGRAGREGRLYFEFTPRTDGMPLYPVNMLIGFPRPIQLRRLFRDMAGLGVAEIHLAGTELGEKSYMQSRLFERGGAEALLREGSAQAKSTHVPRLFRSRTLEECLADIRRRAGAGGSVGGSKFALDIPCALPLRQALSDAPPETPVWAAIGSERGWTDAERAMLRGAGFTLCSLGTRVLRTETAATAAAVLILSIMGRL